MSPTPVFPQSYSSVGRDYFYYDPTAPGNVRKSRATIKNLIDLSLKPHKIPNMQKQLHLAVSILHRIEHFHALKMNWSAFDITKAIREKVRDNTYDIVDTDKDEFEVDGAPRELSVVLHAEVRAIILELFDLNLIPDYKAKNHYDVFNNTSYVLYEFQKENPAPDPKLAAPSPVVGANVVVPFIGTPGIHGAPVMLNGAKSNLKQPDASMWSKAFLYIDNRIGTVKAPTLKRIQSRLKGYKVTCSQLKAALELEGYNLVSGRTPSETTVRV